MGWDLTDEQQTAIMSAAWGVIEPHWEQGIHPAKITMLSDRGAWESQTLMLPGVRDDAPDEVKALERVYGDIVDRGAFTGHGEHEAPEHTYTPGADMTVIEAPVRWTAPPHRRKVFLAGGITDCPDWQATMIDALEGTSLLLLNPRRANFPMDDPSAAKEQIRWEHDALRRADIILFWFCKATMCPITLYELGAWSMTTKPIFVGVEPGYAREADVRIQTKLARPEVQVVGTFVGLAEQIKANA